MIYNEAPSNLVINATYILCYFQNETPGIYLLNSHCINIIITSKQTYRDTFVKYFLSNQSDSRKERFRARYFNKNLKCKSKFIQQFWNAILVVTFYNFSNN